MNNRLTWLVVFSAPMWAQAPLSLKEAARLAAAGNKSVIAAHAAEDAATARIGAARSSYFPRLDYSESVTRSDNPVFVFSSLLTQHQFTAENFALGPLNRPEALNNFRSTLTADQIVYDAGRTKRAVESAGWARDLSSEDSRRTAMGAIARAVAAYLDAQLASEQLAATSQAMRSAEADLARAEARRDAGFATDADVLSIRVHVAVINEIRIRSEANSDVARAALNEALGDSLDMARTLSTSLDVLKAPVAAVAEYEKRALAERTEIRDAKLAGEIARNREADAKSALLPEVRVRAAFEADRQRFYERGGANWLASAELRWNLFNGFGDKARIAESEAKRRASGAREESAAAVVCLEVRRAWAELRGARERIESAQASVAEAEESLRITQNRYDSGFATVTDLLRTESALLEARTRRLSAIHDQRLAAALLELAAGTLTADSEVLN
jgi:outer membrane protein TolC